jgi:hypothetical protein
MMMMSGTTTPARRQRWRTGGPLCTRARQRDQGRRSRVLHRAHSVHTEVHPPLQRAHARTRACARA